MDRLRSLRIESGMTQSQIAEMLSVSTVTIARYESGQREPSNRTLVMLADFFNVTTDYLLGRTDARNAYAHPINLPDGRVGTVYSTEKDLPPQVQEQALQTAARAFNSCPSSEAVSAVTFPDQAALERFVEQLVLKVLSKQAEHNDPLS